METKAFRVKELAMESDFRYAIQIKWWIFWVTINYFDSYEDAFAKMMKIQEYSVKHSPRYTNNNKR